jgi:type I restriction enzyme S subunit
VTNEWPQMKAKYLFQQLKRPCLDTDGTVTAFRDGEVVLRSERREDGFTEAVQYHGYQGVRKGDLVIHSMDAFAGAIGVSKSDGKMSPVAHIYAPKLDLDLRFYAYFLKHLAKTGYIQSLAKGIRERSTSFDPITFSQIMLPVPPLDVQRKISDYLDFQSENIKNIILRKNQLIDEIGSYFDAIVREKILGDYEDSENIPNWAKHVGKNRKLIPLGNLVRIRGEKNDPIQLSQVLSLTAARGVILYEDKGAIGNVASEDVSRYSIVRVNDLVVNCMNVIIGSVGLSKYEGVLSPVYYVLTPIRNDLINMEYLALHFRIREFQRQLIRIGYGILDHRMRIPWINLRSERIVVPPLEVQEQIITELKALDDERIRALNLVEKSIESLSKYWNSTLTQLVTGNLNVSEMERQLA